ncbi:MAG: DUF2344 domain-containing protein [Clostridiales bacterium]|nr:DUF2344 domain-containing protein [Clostridiales bacterium]
MRALYQFGKIGRLRYISHLDLQRFMQRALRRTGLPVAYSMGFNPHAQMAFASALAMGHSSECELVDVRLSQPIEEDFALDQLRRALPPEMPVYRVRLVDDRHPALMATLQYADYRIELSGDGAEQAAAAVDGYMAQQSVIALRRTKSGERPADIRAMTAALYAQGAVLTARLQLTEAATLKPDLLIQTLSGRAGAPLPDARVHRTMLLGVRDGQYLPLIDM